MFLDSTHTCILVDGGLEVGHTGVIGPLVAPHAVKVLELGL